MSNIYDPYENFYNKGYLKNDSWYVVRYFRRLVKSNLRRLDGPIPLKSKIDDLGMPLCQRELYCNKKKEQKWNEFIYMLKKYYDKNLVHHNAMSYALQNSLFKVDTYDDEVITIQMVKETLLILEHIHEMLKFRSKK